MFPVFPSSRGHPEQIRTLFQSVGCSLEVFWHVSEDRLIFEKETYSSHKQQNGGNARAIDILKNLFRLILVVEVEVRYLF